MNRSRQEKSPTSAPPVREGGQLTVEIEDNQDDGIARADRKYVLIIPESDPGDEVIVEVTQTNPTIISLMNEYHSEIVVFMQTVCGKFTRNTK